ncbi:hypothetical protein FQA47_013653 [Oryzias melastigma]|uniref:Uncharacterized protein n=1 Tax=Oryzias melastigma TaxID=30732 RepID=A0A834BWW4_ORYME|nr:hypothetical protein FQA47_013653 [Oryzias melastigma]
MGVSYVLLLRPRRQRLSGSEAVLADWGGPGGRTGQRKLDRKKKQSSADLLRAERLNVRLPAGRPATTYRHGGVSASGGTSGKKVEKIAEVTSGRPQVGLGPRDKRRRVMRVSAAAGRSAASQL